MVYLFEMISYRLADLVDRIKEPVMIHFIFQSQGSPSEDDCIFLDTVIEPLDKRYNANVDRIVKKVTNIIGENGKYVPGNKFMVTIRIFDLIRKMQEAAMWESGYMDATTLREPSKKKSTFKIKVRP